MPLITCSECNAKISSNAESCTQCGNIINTRDGKYVTTQKTKKTWKFIKLIAWILLLIGLAYLPSDMTTAGIIINLSILVWIASKLGAWWTNG